MTTPEEFHRAHHRLGERQRGPWRLGRIVALLDHLGDIVEEEAGDQRRHRGEQQRQGEREAQAGENADDEGDPAGPFRRAGHQYVDPGQRQPGEQLAQREPEGDERQQREPDDLPENRTRLRSKEIGEGEPRRVENHHGSP
ncbi:hypothetical protein ABIA24_003746 [Sinorhizobium fredii]